jgi:hypothetical protein
MGIIILSVFVAHTAWHWMTDRVGVLLQYDLAWPAMDLAFLSGVLRGLMLITVLAGALWVLRPLVGKMVRAWTRNESLPGTE